jgi:hypothetical protein
LANQRVEQGLQPEASLWRGKDDLAQSGTIQGAIRLQYVNAKALGDLRQSRLSRRDHIPRYLVSINSDNALLL